MVAEVMEAQSRQRTLNILHVCLTFGADAHLCWTLELATGRALDCRRQIPPCGAPAPLRARRVEVRCALTWLSFRLRSASVLARGEDMVLRPHVTERPGAPVERNNRIPGIAI